MTPAMYGRITRSGTSSMPIFMGAPRDISDDELPASGRGESLVRNCDD